MNIARKLKQTCVYWAPGVTDGPGNVVYDAGVEVSTRIDNSERLRKNADGDNITSDMVAYFLEASNIRENGKIFLGVLTDLTAAQIITPSLVPDAFIIRDLNTIPSVDGSQSIVVAELSG